jgi:hypothetical protein
LANRRQKRSQSKKSEWSVDQFKTGEPSETTENKPEPKKKQKNMDNGWYRVEGITGHRVNDSDGKKGRLELRVKWAGYSEQTWEQFDGFVKDTAPMVERYLIRNVFRPLRDCKDELKSIKSRQSQT